MVNAKETAQEFIKSAFTPNISILCTPLAEKACNKNNLSFVELLQPFSKLNSDVYYKDSTGVVNTIKNLKLTFLDVNYRPPQTTLARKLLNLSVSESIEPRTQEVCVGEYKVNVPINTPWFNAWKETFLKMQYPSDHEYTQHFLACIMVVSSGDNKPLETMNQLAQTVNQTISSVPGKLPKWFDVNILKFYVILHDVSEGNNNATLESYESIKQAFGAANSFLLRMNSRPLGQNGDIVHVADPWSQFMSNQIESKYIQINSATSSMTDSFEKGKEASEGNLDHSNHPLSPNNEDFFLDDHINDKETHLRKLSTGKGHGLCLSSEDIEHIKLLIYEFAKSCLLPYIERQIQNLNENISNKKGMSRSLFSATKRWFNPNKPGASNTVNNLIYASDSLELQVRKLADIYLMFGNYNLAFNAFHLAKRDYNTDQAWLYYAGALEMASLAAFMANEATKKTFDYMEEGIETYLNTCKMPQFATRATLLGSECLKSKQMFGEAAHQLIRMTSEDSDLRSALLLEEAAYCFLKSKMVRKYAFHMVLAGHRYSKAAQRKHSLRSYKQAYQVYESSGWNLACDHIHYTIGRQANNLQCYEESMKSFSKLIDGESKQTAQQQAIFLKEYLTILQNMLKQSSSNELPLLPIPLLDFSSTRVLLEPTPPLRTPGRVPAMGISLKDEVVQSSESKWNKLEEMCVQEAQGTLPLIFKHMTTLFDAKLLLTETPSAIINEPIQISLAPSNSLQAALNLSEVHLFWTFKNDNIELGNDSAGADKYIKTHVVPLVVLEGSMSTNVVLMLTPLSTGLLTITGVNYVLGIGGGDETISVKGRQVVSVQAKVGNSLKTKTLSLKVVPPAPCLQVTFSELNLDFLCDELQQVTIDLCNTGSVPLHNVHMATTVPKALSNCEFGVQPKAPNPSDFNDMENPSVKDRLARKNHVTPVPLPGNVLTPGQSTSVTIWIKAPSKKGPYPIDLLIYYENVDPKTVPRYRLVRQSWNLTVLESVSVDVKASESHNSKDLEELSIAISSTNVNTTYSSVSTEVSLLSVGLLSRFWTLTKDVASPQDISLRCQESAHVLLKTRRIKSKQSRFSEVTLQPRNFNQKGMMAFAAKSERRTVNTFDDTEFSNFKDNPNGVLVLRWQAVVTDASSERIAFGQSQVPIELHEKKDLDDVSECSDIYLFSNLLEKSLTGRGNDVDPLQMQIVCNLFFKPVVRHDFDASSLCTVPVLMYLHNVVPEDVLEVTVNTSGSRAVAPLRANLFYPSASKSFCWLGAGTSLLTIEPLSSKTINLMVVVYGPGTYDLGADLEILCSKLSEPENTVLQTCQVDSTLIVINGNS